MASYTTNYQLHQWVPGDDFLRTDFNEDFAKIDAGIKSAADAGRTPPPARPAPPPEGPGS